MLILSRKIGQSLVIGEKVVVRVLEVSGENVKIGVEAPREIPVHRQEVFEAIKEENQAAALVKSNVFSCLPKEYKE